MMANRKGQPSRAKSEELGEGDLATKRNPRTGRPVRDSAGTRDSNSAWYVSTVDAVDDDVDSFFDGSEDEQGRPKKRKRSPSPPLPRLENVAVDQNERYGNPEFSFSPSSTPDPTIESPQHAEMGTGDEQPEPETINVTLNIPPGFSGPIHLTIDRNLLHKTKMQRQNSNPLQTNLRGRTTRAQPKSKSKATVLTSELEKENLILKLPAELRIKIYKNLFFSKETIALSSPYNFDRSSALLRTCKTICDEGCAILYGANRFVLTRNIEHRAPLWTRDKKEIGYHDLRLWLDTIGPLNISRIKSMNLCFTDALPSARGMEERRFVRDNHLICSMRLLTNYGQLRDLELTFTSRRIYLRDEFRFLEALRRIKCDELKIAFDHHPTGQINKDVSEALKRVMLRRVKEIED